MRHLASMSCTDSFHGCRRMYCDKWYECRKSYHIVIGKIYRHVLIQLDKIYKFMATYHMADVMCRYFTMKAYLIQHINVFWYLFCHLISVLKSFKWCTAIQEFCVCFPLWNTGRTNNCKSWDTPIEISVFNFKDKHIFCLTLGTCWNAKASWYSNANPGHTRMH